MGKAFVVGIAGGSASGKSTFCSKLENGLGQYEKKVFHMDDYFRAEEERPFSKAPVTGNMYVDDNHPETINLPQLHTDSGGSVRGRL